MNPNVKTLRDNVERLKAELNSAEDRLKYAVRTCVHKWSNPMDASVIIPGGYDPGDPPGTMGIDWRGPSYYPEQRKQRWRRVCSECGYEQFTTETTQQVTHTPKF